MRSPAEHKVTDVRTQVYQAAEAARRAMQVFEPEIRTLAIRQMVVDVEIETAAISMIKRPAAPTSAYAPPSDLLTIDQVAERCHVTHHTVKNWLRTRKLKKTKAGARTLVREADLQAFMSTDASANQRNAA
jgi:excisionase family DNA binding protein